MKPIDIGQNKEQKDGFKAFIPSPFPPKEGFNFDPKILKKNDQATRLLAQPIVNVALIQEWTGFTRAGSQRVIERFIEIGILSPKDQDKKYGQSYMYREYRNLFRDNDK